jgi:RNA polymerase sigma-70 factor, ECF subfamily
VEKPYAELDILPDETLLQLARQGDNTATNLLFSRHTVVLRRTALRYLRNQADSDDAVQDSLLSAYVHLSQFEGRARFKSWLVSIVVNASRAKIRSRQNHWTLSVEEGMQCSRPNVVKRLSDPGFGPDEVFALQERKAIIAESLRSVSPKLRRALYLYYVEGLPVREAACALGVTPQTVKTKLFRGRRELARHLHRALPRAGTRRNENGVSRGGSHRLSEH